MNASSLRSPRSIAALLTGALLLVGALVFLPPWLHDASGEAPPKPDREAVPVRLVEVREHEVKSGEERLAASGTVESQRRVALSFAVSGVVLEVPRDEGESVSEGAVLARLDPVPFESAVQQARARVRYLEKSLARSRNLREQKALSDEEFDAQEAELDAARAQLRLAEWNLGRSALRAPFDAHVAVRALEPGEVVAPSRIAFQLVDLDHLEIRAAIAASDLGRLALQGAVEAVSTDDVTLRATGRIDHRPVESDARSGSVPVLVRLDDPDGRWLPGMVAEVKLPTDVPASTQDELRVPLSALRVDNTGTSVWKVADGRARRAAVTLGPVRGDEVVVFEGLRAGERIIDEAPDRLRDDDLVLAAEVQR